VQLDESHAAHIGREIEYIPRGFGGGAARLSLTQIQDAVLNVAKELIPLILRFAIDCPNSRVAATSQFGDEMSTNEPASASDDNETCWV
jgi:hypothetical protein